MRVELWYYLAVGAILAATLFCLTAATMPAVMQQGNYSSRSFLRWYYRRKGYMPGRHALLSLCAFLLCVLFNLCFSFFGYEIANLISLIPFAGACILFFCSGTRALKVPMKRTSRAIRIFVIWWFLLALVVYGAGVGLSYAAESLGGAFYLFRYTPITFVPLLFPVLYAAANELSKIYDVPHNARFVKYAARALAQSSCKKAGITGSFAKTSVKTMAAAILSQKYRVVATPSSFNTPLGIARTVKEQGLDCDIFLAEMGARRVGDIRKLCDMVQPEYGVITGITSQHFETFGSLENIRKEKGVLAERTQTVILGETAKDCKRDALVEGRDFAAEEIELSENGTKFTLRIGEERIAVETALLGRHAAEDVAIASALCRSLGMNMQEIAAGITAIKPVPHRLEKSEANGVTILDDSYNCNEEGAKCAVEVLKLFSGRKFIVTPGIVELGALEYNKNRALGESLVGLDFVILVGETQILSVSKGYYAAGGNEEKLVTVPTLKAAQQILSRELKEGDCVLFLNDLPDIYG